MLSTRVADRTVMMTGAGLLLTRVEAAVEMAATGVAGWGRHRTPSGGSSAAAWPLTTARFYFGRKGDTSRAPEVPHPQEPRMTPGTDDER